MAVVNSLDNLGVRRVPSNDSGSPSSSRDVKSFWDAGAYGVDSLVSLHSPDEESWTNSQVGCSLERLKFN